MFTFARTTFGGQVDRRIIQFQQHLRIKDIHFKLVGVIKRTGLESGAQRGHFVAYVNRGFSCFRFDWIRLDYI